MKSAHSINENGRRAGDLLKRIPFFCCLTEEELAGLRQRIRTKRFQKSEVILLEEQTADFMYIVNSGRVKAVKIGKDGKENILAIHGRGDFFGEMALLDGKTSPATVIAMEAAEIGLMGKKDFEDYLIEHPAALRAMIALLCSRLREAWSTLKLLTSAHAEERVRTMLAQIGARYGEEGREGTFIRMRLTHEDIARFASVSRETASRLLERFGRAGEIEVISRSAILLKPGFYEKTRSL